MAIVQNQPDATYMRHALGSFATTVNVITTHTELGEPTGMTATAFSGVSHDPPSVLVAINRESRTNQHIAENGAFGVNVLSEEDAYKSNYFATRGQDKRIQADWMETAWDWQSPCLSTAMAFFDCSIREQVDFGTHTIFIGEVLHVGLPEDPSDRENPLVHFRGKYRRLQEQPDGASPLPLQIVINDTYLSEVYF